MLRRFECIKDSGIFQDFRWDAAVPDLARINVIFGRNGTGKTSLSRALDGLRNAEDGQGFKRVSLAFCDGSGTRSTEFVDDPAFDRIHVFGDQYVARSHQFTPAGAEMDAVLTVGERPVDAELRLEKLRSLVRKKSEERDKARQGVSDARQATEAVYKQVSQQVVDAASRAGGRWHSRSNFSAGVVRNAVSGSHREWVALSEETLREKIGIINSDKLDSLPETSLLVAVPSGLHERLVNAFASTPSSLILDTLATHPEATSWVDEGRMLHRDADLCIYCGSNLSADRRGLIDQHFSQEVERLQASLKNIISELVAVGQRVDAALTAIPNRGLFFEDLRARYDDAVEDLRFELIALKRWAEGSRTRAEAKAEQWDIQVDGLRRGKDSKTGKKLSELYPARFLEIRSRHSKIGGKQKRCPILAPWPPSEKSRRKVRSSYHHAFIVVAETLQRLRIDDSLEARLDAQLLCPNVVRRLLETFLAFKRPEWVGDFNGAMRESATLLVESGYRGDAHALRLRLTRYAHAYSHEEDPSTDKTTSPDEIATAILSVFEFMNQLDGQHFEGLCRAAGFDPKDLLPTPLCEFEEPLIDAQV